MRILGFLFINSLHVRVCIRRESVFASCDGLVERQWYVQYNTQELHNVHTWLLIQSDPPQQIGASEAVDLEG